MNILRGQKTELYYASGRSKTRMFLRLPNNYYKGFPCGASSKEPVCQFRRCSRWGSIPGSGRSPGGGHGNPCQYSCLENPTNRGTWWATVLGLQSCTRWRRLSMYADVLSELGPKPLDEILSIFFLCLLSACKSYVEDSKTLENAKAA